MLKNIRVANITNVNYYIVNKITLVGIDYKILDADFNIGGDYWTLKVRKVRK
jgi:hypothetical protein